MEVLEGLLRRLLRRLVLLRRWRKRLRRRRLIQYGMVILLH
jgi:hypothetical protein